MHRAVVHTTTVVLLVQSFYLRQELSCRKRALAPNTVHYGALLQLTIYNRKTSETLPIQAIRKDSNSRIMFMRYLNLAILASTAVLFQSAPSVSANSNDIARQLGDFDWDITPEDGYPVIAFDDTNEDSEVVFKYNFTGNLTDNKFLEVKLFQNDCSTAADASLAFTNSSTLDELDIDLDIIQETISSSVHYQDINATAAVIGFCLRVDYYHVDDDEITESVNFHETNVTITVDLTANFTLTAVSAERTSADNEAADLKLDYPVEAFICLDDNSEVLSPAALAQGSFLQVCVKIDDAIVTENIVVEDILTFVVSQPGGSATDSETITNALADPLTDKVCRESGICNVKTQLLSKFFTETIPTDLQIDGIAILAFGRASLMPSSAPTTTPGRRLRAPIRGLLTGDDVKAFMAAQQNNRDESGVSAVSVAADSSQRMLQDGTGQSKFGLEVSLQGIEGGSGDDEDSSSGGVSTIAATAIVLFVAFVMGSTTFVWRAIRRFKEHPKDIPDHKSLHSSDSSVYTTGTSLYSSPKEDVMERNSCHSSDSSVYTTGTSCYQYSSEYVSNYRARAIQID
jgi:hypothetical protein